MAPNAPGRDDDPKKEKDEIEKQIVEAVKKMVAQQMRQTNGRGRVAVSLQYTSDEMDSVDAEDIPIPTELRRTSTSPGAFALAGPQIAINTQNLPNTSIHRQAPQEGPLVTATLVFDGHDAEVGSGQFTHQASTVVAQAEPVENEDSLLDTGGPSSPTFSPAATQDDGLDLVPNGENALASEPTAGSESSTPLPLPTSPSSLNPGPITSVDLPSKLTPNPTFISMVQPSASPTPAPLTKPVPDSSSSTPATPSQTISDMIATANVPASMTSSPTLRPTGQPFAPPTPAPSSRHVPTPASTPARPIAPTTTSTTPLPRVSTPATPIPPTTTSTTPLPKPSTPTGNSGVRYQPSPPPTYNRPPVSAPVSTPPADNHEDDKDKDELEDDLGDDEPDDDDDDEPDDEDEPGDDDEPDDDE
eukprot:scaffold2193_cov171-Amphora_coffeaeformis.AAC.20